MVGAEALTALALATGALAAGDEALALATGALAAGEAALAVATGTKALAVADNEALVLTGEGDLGDLNISFYYISI